jgi:ribulose-5-phosphate 4-epimerase/fuculose-1-phosphate aldolase
MMAEIDLDAPAVRAARADLAAAFRACGRMGLIEGVANHFSVKLPGHDDLFLVNPEGLHWSELRASDLIVVDTAGNKRAGAGKLRRVAFVLHGVMHRGLAAAGAILHCHPPSGTALAMVKNGRLAPAHATMGRLWNRIAYLDDYTGPLWSEDVGATFLRAFGQATILFMAGHGVTVVGPSIAAAFDDLYFVERLCMVETLARSRGQELAALPAELLAKDEWPTTEERPDARLHFAAIKRQLDRECPDYAE